eukprot:scaffold153643_cov38-Prasinocladus_malaysianus.AAC.1
MCSWRVQRCVVGCGDGGGRCRRPFCTGVAAVLDALAEATRPEGAGPFVLLLAIRKAGLIRAGVRGGVVAPAGGKAGIRGRVFIVTLAIAKLARALAGVLWGGVVRTLVCTLAGAVHPIVSVLAIAVPEVPHTLHARLGAGVVGACVVACTLALPVHAGETCQAIAIPE